MNDDAVGSIKVRIREEARIALSSIKVHLPAAYGELRATIDQLVEDPEQWIPFLASRRWLWREGRSFVLQAGAVPIFRVIFEFPGDGIADVAKVTFADGSVVTDSQLTLRSSRRAKRTN